MESEELRAGKARVREKLIDPLEAMGMKRKPSVTVEQHDAWKGRLSSRLAYMTAENLEALAETVERYAQGKAKDRWPEEISIVNWARALQPPPESDSRMVRTYLQSAAGARAAGEGYVVQLYLYLKRHGHPPNDFALSKIREQADDHMREKQRIDKRQQRGVASPEDQRWLNGYWKTHERCMAIIEAGRQAA